MTEINVIDQNTGNLVLLDIPTPADLNGISVTISGDSALTDTELRATAVAVSGPLTDTELRTTSVPVSINVSASAPLNGQVVIAVTGTAVVLATTTALPGGSAVVTALSTNSAMGTVGDSTVTNTVDGSGNGYILEADRSVVIVAEDLADVYVNGTAGDIFSYSGG